MDHWPQLAHGRSLDTPVTDNKKLKKILYKKKNLLRQGNCTESSNMFSFKWLETM